jgi:hypothetical protein
MIQRVISSSDIIVAICQGAGSPLTKVFEPTIVAIDAAGHATVPIALIVLTYKTFEAAFLVSDPIRQQPKLASALANVIVNANEELGNMRLRSSNFCLIMEVRKR